MMSFAETTSFADMFARATKLAAWAGRTITGLEVVDASPKPPGAGAGCDAADDGSNVSAGLSADAATGVEAAEATW